MNLSAVKSSLISFSAFLIFNCSFSVYASESESIIIGSDTFSIAYGDSVIYMSQDQMTDFDDQINYQLYGVLAMQNGKAVKKNRRGMIGEEKYLFDFYSSDTSILKFKPATGFLSQGFFIIKKVGEVDVIAVLNGADSIRVPIRIEALDILSSFASNMVEDFLGKPDVITDEFLPYNTQKTIDGLYYDTKDQVRGHRVKHWIYNEYPGVVLVLEPVESELHVLVKQPSWLDVADMIQQTY